MNEMDDQGMCILMISSELPEILGMSDRIYVMSAGKINGEMPVEDATQESNMSLAVDYMETPMEDLKQSTSNSDRAKGLWDILKANSGDYFMFFALVIIMIYFTITTDGIFISSRNISNLINQMGYIAVLAVGMTLIIVIRHIDLSVGYLAGFLGAFAAIAMTFWGWPVFAVIPAVMVLGMLAGMLTATPVAKLGVPAFVSTMAAGLIFR